MHGKEEIKQHMTRADAVLIAICFLAAAASAAWFAFGRKEGRTLRVSCDGTVMGTVALDKSALPENTPVYYLFLYEESGVRQERSEVYPMIPEGVSYNLLSVSASGISMEAADCRDQICVRHKPIAGSGESIICLPHRLVVEITGGTASGAPDGVAKAERVSVIAWEEGRRGHETDG